MMLTFPRLLVAAWRLFRRDHPVVLPIAGCFIFLPALAVLLLCDPVPPLPATRDQATMQAWIDALATWAQQGNALAYVVADVIGMFGAAATAVTMLDPRRLTVGAGLRQTALHFWPFVLVALATAVPVGLGMWLLILPGLYAQARLITATPALAHRRGLGAFGALALSFQQTRGEGLAVTGGVVALFLSQWIAVLPLLSADEWLRGAGHTNPAVLALVDALIAAVGSAFHVAVLLLGVVVYGARASRGT